MTFSQICRIEDFVVNRGFVLQVCCFSRYCISCLCCGILAILIFFDCLRSRIIFHNVASEYNSTFVFLVLRLQSVRQNELLLPSSLLHRSPLFTSDLRQVPRRNLFKFLPSFIHCCFCCGNLHGLRHRNKFVYQIVMLQ